MLILYGPWPNSTLPTAYGLETADIHAYEYI